jgi:LPXTG-motif cell wall-anchored protein
MKNIVLTAGLVILVMAVLLYGRKRRRDRIMYLL